MNLFSLNSTGVLSLFLITGGLYQSINSLYYFTGDYTEFLLGLIFVNVGLQSLFFNRKYDYIILGFQLFLGILILVFSDNTRQSTIAWIMGIIMIVISSIHIFYKIFKKQTKTDNINN